MPPNTNARRGFVMREHASERDVFEPDPSQRCACRLLTYPCTNKMVRGERFCWHCLDNCAETLSRMVSNQDTMS